MRRALFWAHLAFGLVGGLVILVLCLTGALLTYHKQITAWVDRDVRRLAAPVDGPVSLERLVARVQSERPGAPVTAVTVYADPAEASVLALGRAGVLFMRSRPRAKCSARARGERVRSSARSRTGIAGWPPAATGERRGGR